MPAWELAIIVILIFLLLWEFTLKIAAFCENVQAVFFFKKEKILVNCTLRLSE